MTNIDLATNLVLAMMRSASTDKIAPTQWWERARTALETGAAVASDFPTLISTMGKKLQIDVTTERTAKEISLVRDAIGDFEEFRRTCEQQSLYVVAFAQAKRAEERIAAEVKA